MLCSTPKNDQYLFFFEGCEFHLTSYESKQVKIILNHTLFVWGCYSSNKHVRGPVS